MPKLPPENSKRALMLNAKIGNRLQKIARMVNKELEKCGTSRRETQFSLIIWGPDRMQYIGTGERSDTKKAMEEIVAKWDNDGEELGTPVLPLGGLTDG